MALAITHPPYTAKDFFFSPKRPNSRYDRDKKPFPNGHKNVSQVLQGLSKNNIISKVLPDLANALSIGGNAFSAATNLLGFSDKIKKFSNFVGSVGTKFFLYVNSAVNTVEQVLKGNYLSAFGYFLDSVIAAIANAADMFKDRGVSSGTYHTSNGLCVKNKRDEFLSFDDHIKHIGESLKKSKKDFFSKNIIKNFLNSENSMYAISGGLLSILGGAMWIFARSPLGGRIREIGGLLKSLEQVNFGHWRKGRKNYFFSGLAMVAATVCDYLSDKVPKLKQVFVSSSLGLDGYAKYLLRLSQNSGELSKGEKSKPELKEKVTSEVQKSIEEEKPIPSIYDFQKAKEETDQDKSQNSTENFGYQLANAA